MNNRFHVKLTSGPRGKKMVAFCLGEIFGQAAAPPQWQQAQEDEAGGFFGGKISGFYGSFWGESLGFKKEFSNIPLEHTPDPEARLYLFGIPESFEDAWGMVVGYLEVLLERPFQSGSSPNTWEIS